MGSSKRLDAPSNGIRTGAEDSQDRHPHFVPPSPELRERLRRELGELRLSASGRLATILRARESRPPGLNDGMIYPPETFPLGTPVGVVRRAAADRAPLTGALRVIVVLVEFSDKPMGSTRQHFEALFFSTGVLPNGSVREYYREVSNSTVDIIGEVVGPYQLPRTMIEYANGESGTGWSLPNAQEMARHAAEAADPQVDFSLYDNDNNRYVDAFIVVHAGAGAESTGSVDDIWSHKWTLRGGSYSADGVRIFAYLTVPETAKIGVCCHELGHLVFGFPDLYDTDYSSEGVGNWCLMGGGSWNGGGNIPAHPSAWCKASQNWVQVIRQTSDGTVNIADVETGHTVYRLWKNGSTGSEYFMIENRQKTLFDQRLPGEGLLIWHIDESIDTNSDESHPKVLLVQADDKQDLEQGNNRGDTGDPYPGSSSNTTFNAFSSPDSNSYSGLDTCVSVTEVTISGSQITAHLAVRCADGNGWLKRLCDWLRSIRARFAA